MVSSTVSGSGVVRHCKQQQSVPSCMTLCLRALRFMDFDRKHDWPGLDETTFRGADHRKRVENAEWAFWNLFQQWDPKTIEFKFEGLFPPTTSLQSTKLRNAFINTLTELKKGGALGLEFVVRKSLFDDCKGERFEQALYLFSAAVLQRELLRECISKTSSKPNPTLMLCTSTTLQEEQKQILQPLILAYESSIRTKLNLKHEGKVRFQELLALLEDEKRTVQQRKLIVEGALSACNRTLSASGVDSKKLKDQVRKNTNLQNRWTEVILDSDNTFRNVFNNINEIPQEHFGEAPTDKAQANEGEPDRVKNVLIDLQARLHKQQERLGVWKDFQKELSKRNELFIVQSPSKSPTKSPLKSPMKSPTKHCARSPRKASSFTVNRSQSSLGGYDSLFPLPNLELPPLRGSSPQQASARRLAAKDTEVAGAGQAHTEVLAMEPPQLLPVVNRAQRRFVTPQNQILPAETPTPQAPKRDYWEVRRVGTAFDEMSLDRGSIFQTRSLVRKSAGLSDYTCWTDSKDI